MYHESNQNGYPPEPDAPEQGIPIARSNDETVRRLLHAFWAAAEYVINEQEITGPEVTTADIGRAIFTMTERFAQLAVKDKADKGDPAAHVNAAAVLAWLEQTIATVQSWPLPALPEAETDGDQ